MPDSGGALPASPKVKAEPHRRRWMSPLLRRILLMNALPPAILAASLLYLDQYQNGLLAAEVESLRTQARIYAAAIGEAAATPRDDRTILVPEAARPLLRRLVEPSPNTQARLFDNTGLLVADSRVREGPGGAIVTEPLPPPEPRGAFAGTVAGIYEQVLAVLPRGAQDEVRVDVNPNAPSFDWQPEFGGASGTDRREELRLALEGGVRPYIRRTAEGRLLVSVAEPARRGAASVGIVLLTREAREGGCAAAGYPRLRPGPVRAGAGADGAAVAVSVAHHCDADPATRQGRRRDARRRGPRRQRARAPAAARG
jgi:two-component system sensor histidine kinase ChvG